MWNGFASFFFTLIDLQSYDTVERDIHHALDSWINILAEVVKELGVGSKDTASILLYLLLSVP